MYKKRAISVAILAMFASNLQANEVSVLPEVLVTATGVETPISKLPVAGSVVSLKDKEMNNPVFMTDQMRSVPGLYIQQIGGEGMLPILRNPPSYKPFIVYAEDGIPVRGVGFFNHHQLNEIDWYNSESMDVIRGPGSLLYGSQNLGGVINFNTRPAPTKTEGQVENTAGSFGFNRFSFTGGTGSEKGGVRVNVLDSRWDGYREASKYDKQAVSLRGDQYLDNGDYVTYRLSHVDYFTNQGSGNRLTEADYNNNPTLNYYKGNYGKSVADRASVSYTRVFDNSSDLTITPFYRQIDQSLMQVMSFTSNGTGVHDQFDIKSMGVNTRYRKDLDDNLKSRVIVGYDYEINDGNRTSRFVTTPSTLVGSTRFYSGWDFTPGVNPAYQYNVKYTTHSPYAQYEFSPTDKLRVFAGARYDNISVDYDNKLGEQTTGNFLRPASQTINWTNLSPKVGATYQLTEKTSFFANYSEGFRTPIEFDTFRPGSSTNSTNLQPTVSYNKEIGFRSWLGNVIKYDVTAYIIDKKNDNLYTRNENGFPLQSSNGVTQHKGVELAWSTNPSYKWKTYGAFTYSENKYIDWVTNQQTGANFNNKTMSQLPSTMGMLGVSYSPAVLNGGMVAAEVVHFGSTFVDDANTWEYGGHNLLNLKGVYKASKQLDVIAKVDNVLDQKHALTYGGTATARQFEPGLPRAAYIGVRYKY
jgi:outer membrane receptor protein involved in Fe transport